MGDGSQKVYICPKCRKYAPADEIDVEKPVCTTDGCEREGKALTMMWMCPACKKCFEGKQDLKQHGKEAHGT